MKEKKIELEKVDLPLFKKESDKSYININCPSCNSKVEAQNIELSSTVAKCGNCDAVFSVKGEIDGLNKVKAGKIEIQRPEGVESFHFRNEMEIEINQPIPILDIIILSIAPFIFIFGILLYFLKGQDGALIASAISSIFTAKSIFRLVKKNQYKTYISVNKNYVSLQHRPKGLSKDKQFSVLDLDQVYARQTTDGGGLFFIINGENGQRHEQILGRIQNIGQLKYIEQEIERYLDIEDVKVSGQF